MLIIFLLIEDRWENPETVKLKLHQRKSVEDVEKEKTKGQKLMSQSQGSSSGDAKSFSQVNFLMQLGIHKAV